MSSGGTGPADTAEALFAGLVDDAGLFPPERLPMDQAVVRHRSDETAGNPVLTQRFLCPASALPDLLARLGPDERWRLGLIADVELDELGRVAREAQADPRLAVETVELRLPDADDPRDGVARVASALRRDGTDAPEVHIELSPAVAGWQEALDAVSVTGLSTKVRCGGLEPAAFPTADELASFVRTAVASGTRFKATAGLHHAVRYRDAQTGFTHHGFLNLLLAVCLAVEGAAAEDVAGALLIEDGAVLADRVRRIDPRTAVRARSLFRAYGSCSTSEPVDDLAALGLLRGAPA